MRVPIATYRLQFNPSFGFKEAKQVLPYLYELGISDIYASPIFKATKGSTHGYDIVDPNELNPGLGNWHDFIEMMVERQKYEMGWLQDIVPNHMAFSSENQMLMDLFENGRQSRFFSFFDIAWGHPDKALTGKVMVPILARLYDKALVSGEIRLGLNAKGFHVQYYEFCLPVRLSSYSHILRHDLKKSECVRNATEAGFGSLVELCDRFDLLAKRPPTDHRERQVSEAKQKLWGLYSAGGLVKEHIENLLNFYNGKNLQKSKFAPFERLLNEQHFKLALWKKASERINYRRFFYLNDFIGLRIEKTEVLEFTHQLLLHLAQEGKFTGLRIDHVDGLYNPTTYLEYLREILRNTYIIVEKILEAQENPPDYWPIQGTTGYEFADCVNKLFCRKENERAFSKIYEQFVNLGQDYDHLVYEKKKFIVQKYMAGDVRYLAHLFKSCLEAGRTMSIAASQDIEDALTEIIAAFPVYRTYINNDTHIETDRDHIRKAVALAASKSPQLKHTIESIGQYLLYEVQAPRKQRNKNCLCHFIMKFQQLTGPAMAKGFEDTVLYNYNRLISLNEVGSQADCFGISPRVFHKFNIERAKRWPHSLNATGTHDTKRGEDVRARINILSEMPEQWSSKVTYWRQINERKKTRHDGGLAPEANDEYSLYQTLIGALPFRATEYDAFRNRIREYFIKAVREAKTHTSWVEPNKEYENGCTQFVDKLLVFHHKDEFWQDFIAFQRKVAAYAVYNSLSEVLIKMTAPGIPDFYQGSELWDLNLVDPDNRRPVDFAGRAKLLAEIRSKENQGDQGFFAELLRHAEDGRIKMFLIHKVLSVRRRGQQIFEDGDYVPVAIAGPQKEHVIAFIRKSGKSMAVAIATRFLTSMISPVQLPIGEDIWKDTSIILPERTSDSWLNVLTEEEVKNSNKLSAGQILNKLPVALLVPRE